MIWVGLRPNQYVLDESASTLTGFPSTRGAIIAQKQAQRRPREPFVKFMIPNRLLQTTNFRQTSSFIHPHLLQISMVFLNRINFCSKEKD